MDINKYIKHDNGSLNYDLIEDMLNALHLRAKEDPSDKLLPKSTLLNVLVEAEPLERHMEATEAQEPVATQLNEPQPSSQQSPVQEFVPVYPSLYSQLAAPLFPNLNAEHRPPPRPRTPRTRCPCGCGEMCSLSEILEHQMQAMADDEREITIISRALESVRITMNLPLCHFSKQLRKAVWRYECKDCRKEQAMPKFERHQND